MATQKTVKSATTPKIPAELQTDVSKLSVTALKQLQSAINTQLKVHEVMEAKRLKEIAANNDKEFDLVNKTIAEIEKQVSKQISDAKSKIVTLISEFQRRPESKGYFFQSSLGAEHYDSDNGYWHY